MRRQSRAAHRAASIDVLVGGLGTGVADALQDDTGAVDARTPDTILVTGYSGEKGMQLVVEAELTAYAVSNRHLARSH